MDKKEICFISNDFFIKEDRVIGRGRPPDMENYSFLTQDKNLYNTLRSKGYDVSYLSSAIGLLSNDETLYTIYSYLYDTEVSDGGMALSILNGMVFDSDYTFCLLLENTVCWFRVMYQEIKKLGTMCFNEPTSMYSCGKFIKRLKYKLAYSGCNLKKVVYMTWDNVPEIYNGYIDNCYSLKEFFKHIKGLNSKSVDELLTALNRRNFSDINLSADGLVTALAENAKVLDLKQKDGRIYSKKVFFKDYSSFTSAKGRSKDCKYGIIFDCEGVLGSDGSIQNGCREVGGIIFRSDNGIMTCEYTFISDSKMLEESLCKLVDVYKSITNSVIPKDGIDVYVFGKSDIIMLQHTIDTFSLHGKAFLRGRFKFIDSSYIIKKYVTNMDKEFTKRRSLSNIATFLGVYAIRPKHNALSDARTLFNIIAHIRLSERSFLDEEKSK